MQSQNFCEGLQKLLLLVKQRVFAVLFCYTVASCTSRDYVVCLGGKDVPLSPLYKTINN